MLHVHFCVVSRTDFLCFFAGLMISVLQNLTNEQLCFVTKWVCIVFYVDMGFLFIIFIQLFIVFQCEREYHVGCLRESGLCNLKVSSQSCYSSIDMYLCSYSIYFLTFGAGISQG